MATNKYWNTVLQEVLHKDCSEHEFVFTNLGEHFRDQERENNHLLNIQRRRNKYYLGEPFPDVYLTQREFDCASSLVNGKTVGETADKLEISPRTVEFYLKNIKTKLKSTTRSELMRRILKTELIQQHVLVLEEGDDSSKLH